ncbi:MAG: hypothetical protein IJZ71_02215 [Treponema sp.]|nr:hypothetical protein [Treponema sp.]
MRKVVFYVFPLAIFFAFLISCQIGLGKEVDLEAPIITLTKMQSGSTEVDSSHFGGGVYCKKTVAFFGKATDNVKVESVNAEIKWNNEVDFQSLSSTTLSGDSFQFDFTFETTGIAYIKFVATDEAGNYNVKSSRVVTLLVDDEAPVGKSWYINRKLNGIQYALKPLEELKELDLDLPENKDAAQNVAFSIHSAFNDEMGIKPGSVSIKIKDESGNLVCEVPNSTSNDYSPVFEITHDILVGGGSQYATGKHYLQVWYNAEDVVTLPESNKAQEIEVDGGWFIWWPESDLPKISQKPAPNEVSNEILLNVKESLTVTLFDDDAISEIYSGLLTDSEFSSIKDVYAENPQKIIDIVPETERENRTKASKLTGAERDVVVSFIAPSSPQGMYLVSYVKDKGGKVVAEYELVNVTDATAPMLMISSPTNNSVPEISSYDAEKQSMIVNIQGQTLDTSGCSFLEFVWIANVNAKDNVEKRSKASSILNGIVSDSSHGSYAPKGDATYKMFSLGDGVKLWSVKLGTEEDAGNGYKKQKFSFPVDLLKDFVTSKSDETNEEKFFLAKVTRKDGKVTIQEYKLASDSILPIIELVTPKYQTEIIESKDDFTLQFRARKENGLPIKTDLYEICQGNDKLNGAFNTGTGCYEYKLSKTALSEFERKNEKPSYTFKAVDVFKNKAEFTITLIVSNLPQLKSITSTSSSISKKGSIIYFNANFSDSVIEKESLNSEKPYLLLNGIKNTKNPNKVFKAEYDSGVGSTTLVFKYTPEDGDYTENKNGLAIVLPQDEFIINANGNDSLKDMDSVHLSTIKAENKDELVLKDKVINIDAISPVVNKIDVKVVEDISSNKKDSKYYLNEGKTIKATLELSESVYVQGSPTFKFDNGIELPFEKSSGNYLYFKATVDSTLKNNSELKYNESNCISNANVITDSAGNELLFSSSEEKVTNWIIDTTKPSTPNLYEKETTNKLTGGNKQKIVNVDINCNDSDIAYYECSYDDGVSWERLNDSTVAISRDSAFFKVRAIDYAGNVSDATETVELYIKSSFPKFSVECTSPDGHYDEGKTITFKVHFEENVKVIDSNLEIIISEDKNHKAKMTSSVANNVPSIDFEYTVKEDDNFTVFVPKDGIKLGSSVKDLFGFEQGSKTLDADYDRPNLHCDNVAPTIVSAIPNDGTELNPDYTADENNIYTTGNQIKITFSEPVQKGSGNIILRQTAGWAIPPVLTAEEFNTICAQLTDDEKNILALRNSDGTLMEDVEDNQLFVAYRNNKYHGTGQYVGPYKKSMQGLNDDGSPDVSAKFVLDFDLDIWDDDSSKNFGKTFNTYAVDESFIGKTENYINDNLLNNPNKIWSAYPNNVDLVTPKEPEKNISVKNIRGVLEKAGLHQRVLDVTSPNVKVDDKVVTITFPKGLIDQTDALPNGREWELVFDDGTFKDIVGYDYTNTGDIIQINNKNSFYSDKVATPVVRVDRYSYGLGIRQANADGNLTAPIANDGVEPTGYVRVRIDCETKDAFVYYDTKKETRDEASISTNKLIFGDTELTNSYITNTSVSIPGTFSTPIAKGEFFAAGSGFYNKSCKEIIATIAKKSNFFDSGIGKEGVFQTVVKFVNPTTGGQPEANQGANKTDWSIRGTTSKGNEPYISPYPLRDTPNGSPYLRLTYRNGVDYYWVSYEVLVDSSFSGHGWARAWRYWYNWAKNWGLMEPGELTKCEDMKNWE